MNYKNQPFNPLDSLDFSLDPCCQKEIESNKRYNAKLKILQQNDIVAARERRRRNLIALPDRSFGCRCNYDPTYDGSGFGDYRSLAELRTKTQMNEMKDLTDINYEIPTSTRNGQDNFHRNEDSEPKNQTNIPSNDDDSDDDSEFDYLLNGPDLPSQNDEIRRLEESRRAELEYELLKREVAVQHGYGIVRYVHPSRILRAAGLAPGTNNPPYAVVIHFIDPDSIASASLDLQLEHIASTMAYGTKFMKCIGRNVFVVDAVLASKVLPSSVLRKDCDIPALIAIRQGVIVTVAKGLQQFMKSSRIHDSEIIPETVTDWLDRCGVLQRQLPDLDEMCRIRPEEEALLDSMTTTTSQNKTTIEVEEEERYDCGVPECTKSFYHEHVGVTTDTNRGLVVPKNDVIGL